MTALGELIEVYGRLRAGAPHALRVGARSREAAECFQNPGVPARRSRVGMNNKVWYLRQNRLFDEAAPGSIESAQHLFTTCLVPKRTRVFDLGDPTRTVFLVKRGKVRISRVTPDGKEVTVTILGDGDLFGEETLFSDAPRTTVATCLEETLLCTAKADDLFALLADNPALALNVAKVLSDRLGEASAVIEDVAYARISDRLMHLFVRLSGEHGVATERGLRIDVRLTHADIASLIGSTRETVSLELANLLKSGRLIQEGRSYVVPSKETPQHAAHVGDPFSSKSTPPLRGSAPPRAKRAGTPQ